MTAFHHDNRHLIRPFDGVGVVLERLRAGGAKLAIWTGRDRASGELLLRDHKLAKHFSTVVYGDALPTHKPDPEGLREILRRLDVPAQEALMVGDADVDVLGAAACGVDAVLIRHARIVEDAVQARAWRTVTSPIEAFELLFDCLGEGRQA
jgi:phosphoglycolate phosphatase-like HAD superfamily hydrolase